MDLYLIKYKYYSLDPIAVTQSQLLPILANKKWQQTLCKDNWTQHSINELQKYHLPHEATNYYTDLQIIKYDNVKDSYWQINNFGYNLITQYTDCHILSDCHVIKILLNAKKWLKQKATTEKWPGQMQYLSTSNKLGHQIKLPEIYIKTHYKHTQHHIPHNATGYQHPRVGYCKSAFARSNYIINNNYDVPKGIPLRHLNRKYQRKHPEAFPWWDDNEYIRSSHSTGWKYSTKFKHQYLVHQKKHQNVGYYDNFNETNC